MSDTNLHEIERSLEQERLALAQSLNALTDRLSPSHLMAEGKEALRAQAGPMLSHLDAMVRAQPIVAAAAGVALAALILGRRRADSPLIEEPGGAMAGTRYEALTRWEDEGGPPAPAPVDPHKEWLDEAQGLRSRAQHLLDRIDDAARRGLAPAAQLAKHRAEVLAALSRDTRKALLRGLDGLTGAARDQAIEARERLWLARLSLAEKSRMTVETHPFASGAVALAAGAAVACLFPPTEAEDHLLGDARDRLLRDAQTALRDEALRASALARSLQDALHSDMRQMRGLSGLH
ncbi:MAG: DUF3618 domain-containing protein [Gemmobacter sp.]|uniref:DUF3618 domain-containing protein n=1 Tax=Gemmobacter sp. TaxID=1898957 RepID=UPI001A3F6A86|nr:DUF3618 domain-containing protein [Gemmobacter sp.]MBL8561735.1 DUF3618 domain-containing protein [Gemmobacter sp.]